MEGGGGNSCQAQLFMRRNSSLREKSHDEIALLLLTEKWYSDPRDPSTDANPHLDSEEESAAEREHPHDEVLGLHLEEEDGLLVVHEAHHRVEQDGCQRTRQGGTQAHARTVANTHHTGRQVRWKERHISCTSDGGTVRQTVGKSTTQLWSLIGTPYDTEQNGAEEQLTHR